MAVMFVYRNNLVKEFRVAFLLHDEYIFAVSKSVWKPSTTGSFVNITIDTDAAISNDQTTAVQRGVYMLLLGHHAVPLSQLMMTMGRLFNQVFATWQLWLGLCRQL